LALARPDLTVTLIEPLLRRSLFLEEVLVELDLSDRVQVVRKRGEEVRERADVVVARAVAPLDRLVAATAHLFAGGRLFALKGEKAAAELAAAAGELQARGLEATLLWAQAHPQTTAARVVRVAEAGQVAPTEPAEEI
jgi:16S rRNA (guanine527-N7)-methyltransferase